MSGKTQGTGNFGAMQITTGAECNEHPIKIIFYNNTKNTSL